MSPHMDMAGGMDGAMDAGNSSSTMMGMMDMSQMAMVFFTSANTPLYSMSWTPSTDGQYAGTCIFLIAFAAIFRALIVLRTYVYDTQPANSRSSSNSSKHKDAHDSPVAHSMSHRPWRTKTAVQLAALDVALAGVGYLLMLAVMTMNVGYFLSVLAGVFVGSMAFGQFMNHTAIC